MSDDDDKQWFPSWFLNGLVVLGALAWPFKQVAWLFRWVFR